MVGLDATFQQAAGPLVLEDSHTEVPQTGRWVNGESLERAGAMSTSLWQVLQLEGESIWPGLETSVSL